MPQVIISSKYSRVRLAVFKGWFKKKKPVLIIVLLTQIFLMCLCSNHAGYRNNMPTSRHRFILWPVASCTVLSSVEESRLLLGKSSPAKRKAGFSMHRTRTKGSFSAKKRSGVIYSSINTFPIKIRWDANLQCNFSRPLLTIAPADRKS